MKYFLTFDEDNCRRIDLCGGKGASLAMLYANGFNVPYGFVISAEFYKFIFQENEIAHRIAEILTSVNVDSPESLNNCSEKIGKIIDSLSIDKFIERNFGNQLSSNKRYAVRSSAVAEDGKDHAWAGQLSSFLNVKADKITGFIKKCWASAFSSRAIYYRKKINVLTNMPVAVVVQEMIDSDFAGVAFSVNPASNSDEIVVESVAGLGEAIVSGSVTPSTFFLFKDTLFVREQILSKQRKLIRCTPNGVDWLDNIEIPQIDSAQVVRIAEAIISIEKFYGFPVDVEWAVKEGKLFILQARPITTLGSTKKSDSLSQSIINRGDWEFYVSRKFNWFIENTQIYGGSEKFQNEVLGFNVALNNYLILNGDEYCSVDENNKNYGIFAKLFKDDIKFFDKFAKIEFGLIEEIKNYISFLNDCKFNDYSHANLIKILNEFNDLYCRSFVPTFARPDSFLEREFRIELKKLNLSINEEEKVFSNIATCPDNDLLSYSAEPVDLLKIAIKQKNGEDTGELLKEHILKYSWLKSPVSSEPDEFSEVDYIDRLNFIVNDSLPPKSKIESILNERKKNEINFEDVLIKYNFSARAFELAKAIRSFIFLRTYTTEYSDKLFYTAKKSLFKFIADKCNLSISDIVMLTANDIEELIESDFSCVEDKVRIISERRIGFYIVWLNGKVTTGYGLEAKKLQKRIAGIFKGEKKFSNVLAGQSAYRGIVRGRVKILNTYNDIAKVNKGDIIVASMTTPDFVAAMEKAGGFITDEGGITCHAAIISREFHVPCIVGTGNATELLKDDDLVELNANSGKIFILK